MIVKSVAGKQKPQDHSLAQEVEAIQRNNVSMRVIKMKLATLHHVQNQVTATCRSIVLKKVVLGGLDSESHHTEVYPYFMLNKNEFNDSFPENHFFNN